VSINEKLFRISADHLILQGRKCILHPDEYGKFKSTNNCALRNKEGLKCAVGALISDEYYNDGLEAFNVYTNHIKKAIASSQGIPEGEVNSTMIWSLQIIHDDLDPSEWSQELTDFANLMGFNWTPESK
jgi:hypothetical protein